MNKIYLIGNMVRDPELRQTPSGASLCRFSIAVQRRLPNIDGERETDFFECTAWRGTAESITKYVKKGNKLAVIGSVQNRSYEDNQGIKRTVTDVIAEEVEFLTPKQTNEENEATAKRGKAKLEPLADDSDIPF